MSLLYKIFELNQTKSYLIYKIDSSIIINSINICVPMTQIASSEYNFCTLNQLSTPKALPSLDFVGKLLEICYLPNTLFESLERNLYDRKNHILFINNYEAYSRALKQKCGRTVSSFEKQLKMMGFKKKIIKQHNPSPIKTVKQEPDPQINQYLNSSAKRNNPVDEKLEYVSVKQQKNNRNITQTLQQQRSHHKKYMFIWRTNRTSLIQKQLLTIEQDLSERIEKVIVFKQQMEKRKKQLDSQLETILLENIIFQHQSQTHQNCSKSLQKHQIMDKFLKNSIYQLKSLVNHSQIESKQLISSISLNASAQLQLYRTLIFKQNKFNPHPNIEQQ